MRDSARNIPGVDVDLDDLIRLRMQTRGLQYGTRRKVSSAVAGIHLSRFRGRGVDYQESRSYQHGDDIRNMDWRVTARTGKPHTKLFQEERERPVILLLDCNSSMFFGTRTRLKSVQATRLAALVAWATVRHGDRIGAFSFRQHKHQEIKPVGGKRGALRLLSALKDWYQPRQQFSELEPGSMAHALKRLRRLARPGTMVFIISDFYAWSDDCQRHLNRLAQHNDIFGFQVYDQLEMALPEAGSYGISDGSNRGIINTSRKSSLQAFEAFSEHTKEVAKQAMRQSQAPLIQLATDDSVVDALRQARVIL